MVEEDEEKKGEDPKKDSFHEKGEDGPSTNHDVVGTNPVHLSN